MANIYEYAMLVRTLGRDRFIAQLPHPFLLMPRPKGEAEEAWTFRTRSITSSGLSAARLTELGIKLSADVAQCEVFPVLKTPTNPWPGRVSIGRARNNDIVLADNSVSKLHAHFRGGTGAPWQLSDAGSHNGTTVRGRRLGVDETVIPHSGDPVTFGRIAVVYLDAAGLYELIVSGLQ